MIFKFIKISALKADIFLSQFLREYEALVVFIENDHFRNPKDLKYLDSILSEDEKLHKIKIHPYLQSNFVIHRGFLRFLLSNIMEIEPAKIDFVLSAEGKPRLQTSINFMNLHFNLSHSKNYAMYAFSMRNIIGIDIEEDIRGLKVLEVAELAFSKTEIEELILFPEDQQRGLFFKLWTHKEAISKALGRGLLMDFRKINLGIDVADRYQNLQLADLSKPSSYYACLAYADLKSGMAPSSEHSDLKKISAAKN